MFLKIRKKSQIYMQNNEVGKNYAVPVTSNFLINLQLVAEVSTYSLKEDKEKQLINGKTLLLPQGSCVVHLTMSYNFGLRKLKNGTGQSMFEKAYYKLYFVPEALGEYEMIKRVLDERLLN